MELREFVVNLAVDQDFIYLRRLSSVRRNVLVNNKEARDHSFSQKVELMQIIVNVYRQVCFLRPLTGGGKRGWNDMPVRY